MVLRQVASGSRWDWAERSFFSTVSGGLNWDALLYSPRGRGLLGPDTVVVLVIFPTDFQRFPPPVLLLKKTEFDGPDRLLDNASTLAEMIAEVSELRRQYVANPGNQSNPGQSRNVYTHDFLKVETNGWNFEAQLRRMPPLQTDTPLPWPGQSGPRALFRFTKVTQK